MSQKSSTVNFVIRDANGQPQMVKVVQNTNQTGQIKLKQNPVKIIKLPGTSEVNTQAPHYRTVKLSGIKCASTCRFKMRTKLRLYGASWRLLSERLKVERMDFEEQRLQSLIKNPFNKTVNTGLVPDMKLVQVPVDTFARLQKVVPKTEPVDPEEIKEQEEEKQGSLAELNIIKTLQVVPVETKPETSTTTSNSKSNYLPTMSSASRRRHDSDNEPPPEYTTKRRKHADKVGKGLRHFSMKVCEKVRTKGFTSYNEVADELVLEFSAGMHGSTDSQQYDQKNIRRRVYDALNVLMAMNIISKEKKEIRWLGLPTNSVQECTALEQEKQAKLEKIQKKTQQLQELILQHISFKSLVERNKEAESKGVKPSPSSAIHLPFIVVNTSDKALIDCSISNDKTEYMFNFNKRFQIHDDIDILKRMGLLYGLDKGECSEEEIERVKSMVPKSLEYYVEQMGRGVSSKLTSILEEELDETVEDEAGEGEAEGEAGPEGEAEGAGEAEGEEDAHEHEYSDDSSDVDV